MITSITFTKCHTYLNNIDTNWQLYKAHERGILLHDRKTNNVVECINGWLLKERFQSVFYFIKSTISKVFVNLFNYSNEISRNYHPICPVAEAEFNKLILQFDLQVRPQGFSFTINQTQEDIFQVISNDHKQSNNCGKTVILNPKASCSCDIWQQDHNPCKHIVAVLKNKKIHPTTIFNSNYFHYLSLNKTKQDMVNNCHLLGTLPNDEMVANLSDLNPSNLMTTIICKQIRNSLLILRIMHTHLPASTTTKFQTKIYYDIPYYLYPRVLLTTLPISTGFATNTVYISSKCIR